MGARRARAIRLAHKRGEVGKATITLESPAPFPRNNATLSIPRNEYPFEAPHGIHDAREKMAEVILEHQPPEKPRVPGIQRPFDPEHIRTAMTHACPQSGLDPNGLGYRHLQSAVSVPLVDDIASCARTVLSSDVLPDLFGSLYASARLTALGEKVRPVACGNVLRRIIAGTFCWRYETSLDDVCEPWCQYRVSLRGGLQVVAEQAMKDHLRGYTVLSFDGTNA